MLLALRDFVDFFLFLSYNTNHERDKRPTDDKEWFENEYNKMWKRHWDNMDNTTIYKSADESLSQLIFFYHRWKTTTRMWTYSRLVVNEKQRNETSQGVLLSCCILQLFSSPSTLRARTRQPVQRYWNEWNVENH